MLFFKRIESVLSQWKLFNVLSKAGKVGFGSLLLFALFCLFTIVWHILPFEQKATIAANFYFILILSIIFSFFFSALIFFTSEFNIYIRLLILSFINYFGLNPTLGTISNYFLIATQLAMSYPLVKELNKEGKSYYLKLMLIALVIGQFPPFPIEIYQSLFLKIAIKVALLFFIFWLINRLNFKLSLSKFLFPFTFLTISFIWSLSASYQAYFESFKMLVLTLWNTITIPLWLLLAGDLVDEVGRFGKIIAKPTFSFIKKRKFLVLEIVLVFLIAILVSISWFFPNNYLLTFFDLIHLPNFLEDYKSTFVVTLRFISPIVVITAIISIFLLKNVDVIELRNRFNQTLFAIFVFTFQILYSYYFTNELEVQKSLTGFAFVLLALSLFWEPIKITGLANVDEFNLSIILLVIFLLTGTLIDLGLVWYPLDIAKVTILYQILGGIVVGFPVLFLRVVFGWDYDEKFMFRNFFLGFSTTLVFFILFPNKYWISLPLGYFTSILGYKMLTRSEISVFVFLALGFGTIAQSFIVWVVPIPIIPLVNTILNNLFLNVPFGLFEVEHFLLTLFVLVASLIYFFVSKIKFTTELLSCTISVSVFFALCYFFIR
ncbi:MAG: hypothetical protein N2560_05160 [Ignavibacteria bacterium]|nr:hypothetical protein [Ignavibacteria bacterium]